MEWEIGINNEGAKPRSRGLTRDDTVSVVDDPRVVEQLLRHPGAWQDPPPKSPPQGLPGPYTYEPCDDVDPDYEHILADRKERLLGP